MLRFLFWNVNRRPVESWVAAIARDHDIDVILLAESKCPVRDMERALNRHSMHRYHFARPDACEKIQMFVRFPPSLVRPVWDGPRMTLRELDLPGRSKLLIGGVHLQSKLHVSERDQDAACVELASDVAKQEDKAGHTRTLLAGDFNMNPFEHGLASARGFNAAMTAQIARRGTRTESGRQYRFFYNPMWNHFGEQGPNPPGTYYYAGSTHLWNMFDQVMIRPDLAGTFLEGELRVLTAVSGTSLVTPAGTPCTKTGPDHLPLLFALDL